MGWQKVGMLDLVQSRARSPSGAHVHNVHWRTVPPTPLIGCVDDSGAPGKVLSRWHAGSGRGLRP